MDPNCQSYYETIVRKTFLGYGRSCMYLDDRVKWGTFNHRKIDPLKLQNLIKALKIQVVKTDSTRAISVLVKQSWIPIPEKGLPRHPQPIYIY